MVLSLDIEDMATAIVILIFFDEVSSLLKVDPNYLKESTTSRFWPFITKLMGVFWLVLLTSTLLSLSLFQPHRLLPFLPVW